MGKSVFGADTSTPLVVKADKAIITCGGKVLMALDISVTFTRSVQKVPVLGPRDIIAIGSASGTVTINTLLANDIQSLEAMHLDDDGCTPFAMDIKFQDSACSMNGEVLTAHNCVGSTVTISARAGQGFIAEGVTLTCTALTRKNRQ